MLRFVWLTLLCWTLSAPLRLHADSGDYDAALEAALAAHARGDLTTARTSMERAHALSPSARTLRGLAIIAHAQGRHVEAVLGCDAALASEVQALTPRLRDSVEELRARSLRELAWLRLSITPADAAVTIDGQPPSRRADGTLLLAPGTHLLQVSAPGFIAFERVLDAKVGESEGVEVSLAAVPDAAPQLAPVESTAELPKAVIPAEPLQMPLAPPRDRGWTPRRRNLTLTLGGLGTLGGGALLIVAARKFADVDHACGQQPAGACTHAEAARRLDDAHVRPYLRASAGLLAVGGATLITALTLELWSWRAAERATVALTPNGARLRGTF